MTFDDLLYLRRITGLIDVWEGGQGQAHTRQVWGMSGKLELGSHALNGSLSDSAVSKWLQEFLADAKEFGRRAIGQLPRKDAGA